MPEEKIDRKIKIRAMIQRLQRIYCMSGSVNFMCTTPHFISQRCLSGSSIITRLFHVMKLKLNEVKWLIPGNPSRSQTSGNLTAGAKLIRYTRPSPQLHHNYLYELGQVMPIPLGLSFSNLKTRHVS